MRFLLCAYALFCAVVVGAAAVAPVDTDHDGVDDATEDADGTDKDSADTDRDGAEDGVELAQGLDALDPDSDNDGVFDGVELEMGTDPHHA